MKKKLIYGVGVNDANYVVNPNKGGICKFYSKWRSMIQRAYSVKFHDKYPTYKDISVCKEWLVFSNFKSWMETQNFEGKALDKDLRVRGSRIYSPETCIFLDQRVNSFMATSKSNRGDYLIGVSWCKERSKFEAYCSDPKNNKKLNLGRFSSEIEAHKAWKKKKLELAMELSELPENKYLGDLLIKRYTFEENEICNY